MSTIYRYTWGMVRLIWRARKAVTPWAGHYGKKGRAVSVREDKMRRKEMVERRRRVPVNSYQGTLPLKTIPR